MNYQQTRHEVHRTNTHSA